MNRLSLIMLITIMGTFGCNSPQEIVEKNIKVELSETPIWVNSNCEGKTITCRFENIDPKGVEAKLDDDYLEIKFIDSNVSGVEYGELFLPGHDKNKTLKILDKVNEKLLLSEEIKYVQPGDTINYYSNNIQLPRPIIVSDSKCWTSAEGAKIPSHQEYKIHYELERKNLQQGENIIRTLTLKNISFEDIESKKTHNLPTEITHSKTVSNFGDLENETEKLNSDKKLALDINVGNQLNGTQLEYATIISGQGGPSYRVIENIYGTNIKGIIGSCSEVDTLFVNEMILPEFIQIGMNCK